MTAMVDLFLGKSSLGISEKDSRKRRRQGYISQERPQRTRKRFGDHRYLDRTPRTRSGIDKAIPIDAGAVGSKPNCA